MVRFMLLLTVRLDTTHTSMLLACVGMVAGAASLGNQSLTVGSILRKVKQQAQVV